MSYRLKITLPIALAEQLNELAASTGEPAARLAAQMVRNGLAETRASKHAHTPHADTVDLDTPEDQDAFRASWLEPYGGDREWSMWMWGGIVALHGRRDALRPGRLERTNRQHRTRPTRRDRLPTHPRRGGPDPPPRRRQHHPSLDTQLRTQRVTQ